MDLQSNRDLAELLRKIGVRDRTKLRLQDTEMPVVITGDVSSQAKPVFPGKAVGGGEVAAPGAGLWGGIVLIAHQDLIVEQLSAGTTPAWIIPDQLNALGGLFTLGAAISNRNVGDPLTPVNSTMQFVTINVDPGTLTAYPSGTQNVLSSYTTQGWFIPSAGRIYIMTVTVNIGANMGIQWREPR